MEDLHPIKYLICDIATLFPGYLMLLLSARSFAHDGIASYRLTLSRWRLFSVYTLTEAETLSRNLKEKEMSPMIKD
jgi:hypothetical protein